MYYLPELTGFRVVITPVNQFRPSVRKDLELPDWRAVEPEPVSDWEVEERTYGLVPAGRNSAGRRVFLSPVSGIRFVEVAGDSFEKCERDQSYLASPWRSVHISTDFLVAETEVTQAQWKAVMFNNPSYFRGGDLPVDNVTWRAAMQYCAELTDMERKEGRTIDMVFRLPTDAEWEFCCRAGTKSCFSFGRYDGWLGRYAWFGGNSDYKTHPVAGKKPNPWGLYDMHGNVLEWCFDTYNHSFSDEEKGHDPVNLSEGATRVLRGGS